jgi:mannosyltransferase OCH1-like enzyme
MLDTFYPRVYTLDPHKEYYHPLNNKPIPKIIHQLAPADKSKWVKSWFDGHKSVKKFFPEPEFKHMMWTDEKIYDFVYKVFPQYYDTFMSYPYLINKIDMVRYMILYVYGGIYIDMDFIISKNFYPLLSVGKIHLIRSVWFFNEKYQNSMMASPQGEEFWLNILEIGFNGMRDPKVYNKYIKKKKSLFTITMTGPRLLDALVSHSNRDKIQNIPYYGYGKHMNSSVYTKGTNGLKNI